MDSGETLQPVSRSADCFLVCGLGSLGQYCVAKLKEFGVQVWAIDTVQPTHWEIPGLSDLLADLVIGDCRQPEILLRARIQDCRAVLLVASDERINLDAAFAIRLLNPHVRLVVRSSKQNLNELLEKQLGNFVALEAMQLPAPAFAIAALESEIQGLINLDDHLLRIVKYRLDSNHPWCNHRSVYELNSRTCRILSHGSGSADSLSGFYEWDPNARVQAGDLIAYVEVTNRLSEHYPSTRTAVSKHETPVEVGVSWQTIYQWLSGQKLQQWLATVWQATAQQQSKRVALVMGVTVGVLIMVSMATLKTTHPQETWWDTLYVTGVMLLGSYDTVFGALNPTDTVPLWMRFMNLFYMLAGTAATAVLFALLTESLLAAKFQLPNRRPPLPSQNHVVLIGLGRVGQRVAALLQKLNQPVVVITTTAPDPNILPQMPIVVDDLAIALDKVNLTTAKSVVVTTDDEMLNLEIGLRAQAINPKSGLVIRTFDPRFSDNLARLLPQADVLCVYALAAEAYATAAFGENILSLLRLNDQTVLVVEYVIQPDEPIKGLLLAEVAYGYGMVPVLYQDIDQNAARLMPSDDIRLELGDRLVVLATPDSLHRIEQRNMHPRTWQVQVDRVSFRDGEFEGARIIARITGCNMTIATKLMHHLPGILPILLYQHQAQRLVRELMKFRVLAHVVPLSPVGGKSAPDINDLTEAIVPNE